MMAGLVAGPTLPLFCGGGAKLTVVLFRILVVPTDKLTADPAIKVTVVPAAIPGPVTVSPNEIPAVEARISCGVPTIGWVVVVETPSNTSQRVLPATTK